LVDVKTGIPEQSADEYTLKVTVPVAPVTPEGPEIVALSVNDDPIVIVPLFETWVLSDGVAWLTVACSVASEQDVVAGG
jgi:hypothetical protein